VARALHRQSSRAEGPFVAINCAAIPSTLLESELFGHERGAFTGAVTKKVGRLELARGGTLFLDEIGDMDFAIQAKLLRVIQERVFERVGGSTPIETDFRLISATNKDFARAVREGQFREDLYFRLNVVSIRVPPLREKVEDVPLLVKHFVEKYAKEYGKSVPTISDDAMRCLAHYSYPGNIRELENLVQRMIVLARGNRIEQEDLSRELGFPSMVEPQSEPAKVEEPANNKSLPAHPNAPVPFSNNLHDVTRQTAETVEREMIVKVLTECRWKRGDTARNLGISRRSLLRKMNKYAIE
jgi:DNA-binding NtrC family response regulator